MCGPGSHDRIDGIPCRKAAGSAGVNFPEPIASWHGGPAASRAGRRRTRSAMGTLGG